MKGWSKAVGAGLGYFVGGPIGAVLGYMAGNKLAPKLQAEQGHLLIANLLGFTALLLKNRPPSHFDEQKHSVAFISTLFTFDAEDQNSAEELLQRLLLADLDVLAMAKTFRRNSNSQMRLRLMEILCTLCLLIHGRLQGAELGLLNKIAETINLTSVQWDSIRSRYQGPTPKLDTACCYALLEVYPASSADEIRASYRRLAKKYHPDRNIQQDQTSQIRQVERMTLINSAYQIIQEERGLG
jgi:DnaJ like chaperone protein